jgi:Tfp pilus assembly protein PilZ
VAAQKRRFERFAPIIIRGELASRRGRYPGYLTNLSVGGTFYHADELPGIDELVELTFELPWNMGECRVRAKVVWLRSEASGSKRGAGLYFHEFENDTRARISSYLEKFQSAAEDVLVR